MTESGHEPGGWELLRAIQSLTTRFDDATKGFVTITVHTLLVERVKEVEAALSTEKAERIADIKTEREAREKAVAELRTAEAEQKKSRAQTVTALIVAAATALFTLISSVVRGGFGLP